MSSITKEQAELMNESRWGKFEDRYDWKAFQEKLDGGQPMKKIGLSYSAGKKAIEMGLLVKGKRGKRKHTQETKATMSEKRKQWLKDNPDKHPWRNKDKFKSEPCEKVKDFLTNSNIPFISEYQPMIDGRYFSIDIAMPDKMIAIEIDGNQHYERNGHLKTYYQERHNLLEDNGWIVYELHYSVCFKLEKLKEFFNKVETSEGKVDFDYLTYIPKEKSSDKVYGKKECGCGKLIHIKSNQCASCKDAYNLTNRRNPKCPSKEVLEQLIWDYPMTKVGEMFGVSDNAIRKWCKKEGITNFPSSSYRRQQYIRNGDPAQTQTGNVSLEERSDIQFHHGTI